MPSRWIISCEHGGNLIPPQYAYCFTDAATVLQTHRGWDPGALSLWEKLSPLADFSLSSTVSRLLVELNRSLHHPKLFSSYSGRLSYSEKQEVLQLYYKPYRNKIEETIRQYILEGAKVYHLSIHSFTPELDGIIRQADIGLLYDPARSLEKEFCKELKHILKQQMPKMRVRFNYPYLGKADGFTTYLRRQFPENYAGVELELNQHWADQEHINSALFHALQTAQKQIS